MERRKRKLLSTILVYALILIMLPVAGLVGKPAMKVKAEEVITRAEWLQDLAETFEMSVEDDNYPDNYFSDLDSSSEYYYDVLLNVEFGVIDVPAGGEVMPDEPVTREFAARTLNYCLGYQLDEEATYTFSDVNACQYPDDMQIALNRGWFTLVDKNVQPALNITTAEATAMLADAEAVLSGDVITEQGGDYEFADDVVIITNYCEVDTADDGTVTVSVKDLKQSITKNTRFAVYQNLIPVVYVADTVKKSGSVTTITATVDQSGTAYTEAEAQGVINGSIAYVEALDGTEVIYIDEETGDEYNSAAEVAALYGARSSKMYTTTIAVKKEIEVGQGKVEVELKIKNAKISYDFSFLKAYAKAVLEGEMETKVSMSGKVALSNAIGLEDIRMVNWVVPGVGGFVVTLDAELEGSVSTVWKGDMKVGLHAGAGTGFRIIKNFKAKTFTIVMQVEGKIGVTAKFGLTELPVLKGYVYATTGGKAAVETVKHGVGYFPSECIDFSAYIYASYGVEASLEVLGFEASYKMEKSIFDENNSPIRVYRHYENGMEVAECTARLIEDDPGSSGGGSGSESKPKKYYTPTNSSWGGSGWSEGKLSAGYNNDGTQIPAFEYKLNSDKDGAIITKYGGSATSIAIPEYIDGYPVVGIGSGVFQNKTKLVSVFIPDSVKSIGTYAFSGCMKLSTVNLPNKLVTMGHNAFANCTELYCINIPKSLTDISANYYSGPFTGCTKLKKVVFETGITRIPAYLFDNCTGLLEIEIPDTVTTIGVCAFDGCTNLATVTLPDSITTISNYAFNDCITLNEVELPGNLNYLGYLAFGNCDGLTSIEIPKKLGSVGVTSVWLGGGPNYRDGGPFTYCDNLNEVTFEKGIKNIPANIFTWCVGVENVVISDTVTSVGSSAFKNCYNLKSVVLPDSITTINHASFYNCYALEKLELPRYLVSIGSEVFYNCDSLESVVIPKTLQDTIFDGYYYRGAFPYCNELKTITFEDGMTVIPNSLLCYSLVETVILPDGLLEIECSAFSDCTLLKNIELPDSINEISFDIFENCTSLKEIKIPESVTKIDTGIFEGCSNLQKVVLPKHWTKIPSSMFSGCVKLESIDWPENLEIIGDYAFDNSGIKEVILPDGVKNIEMNAFANCSNLTQVKMGTNLKTLKRSAFNNCDALTKIVFNDNLQSIGQYCFQDCDALTSVSISDAVSEWGTYVFNGCDALVDVKLGKNITSIPQGTFQHCDVLEKLQLPYRVASIGSDAFKDCIKFTEITIPRATTTINSTAFSYPGKLTIYGVPGTYAETFAKENSINFVSKEVAATKVLLSETAITLNEGQSTQLILQVTPADFTDEVTWKSGDTNVATVDTAGNIVAVGSGSTVIRVTVGKVSASCTVTVYQPVTNIYLNKSYLSLEGDDTYQLNVTIYPDDANNKEISWSSSDEKVATVDNTGLVKAVAKGTAIITVMTKDGSEIKKTCEVTVTNNVYRVSKATELESPHNYTDSCSDSWIYQKSGAQLLKVTFDKNTNIEDGFDYLYLYDAERAQVGKYTGTQLAGKTIEVKGDTVRIKLVSDASGNTWGFKVTDIKAIESTPTPTPTPNPGSTETPDLSGLFATSADGNFVKDGTEVRCYNLDGTPVINEFKCDGTYTYYFQADGTAMRDRLTYHPDGVHVIYFDENGHEVFSNFANVKKTIAGLDVDDYCFFDVYGYLYVDVVTYDQTGTYLYYANPYGVMDRGKWFEFSESVKWADGTPFDKAGGKYGYANEDGTLMINQWTYDWEGRQCYMQGNGVALYP